MFDGIQDEKLKLILIAAKDLFWKFGIKRVTVEEVCSVAKVSKMTFYKHFKNKIELVIRVYEIVVNESLNKYRNIMDSIVPFSEKIQQLLELKRESVHDISQEFYEDLLKSTIPEIQEMIQEAKIKNYQVFMSDLVKAQKQGEVREDIKPEFIMFFMNHMIEMAQNPQLANLYSTPEELVMELNKVFFYSILPRK